MKTLTPAMASVIADYCYVAKNQTKLVLPRQLSNDFDLNISDNPIQGQSGILFFRKTTGFAITAKGKPKSAYCDHHILAIRGTDMDFLPDKLTDGFISASISHNKKLVHGGFDRVFNSIKADISRYLLAERPLCTHVVGHSLGGAIANLTASFIQQQYGTSVKLYTFDAPRVGTISFANELNLSSIEHHRVIHPSDPVTVIPVWPFVHAGDALEVCSHAASLFALEAHRMKTGPGYINTAGAYRSYHDMRSAVSHLSDKERIVLYYERRFEAAFNSRWERLIRCALLTILEDAEFMISTVQSGFMSVFTVYDLIAKFLDSIVRASDTFADRVKGLIGHIYVFVGQAARTIRQLSYAVIREAFDLMIKKLAQMAKDAIKFLD